MMLLSSILITTQIYSIYTRLSTFALVFVLSDIFKKFLYCLERSELFGLVVQCAVVGGGEAGLSVTGERPGRDERSG